MKVVELDPSQRLPDDVNYIQIDRAGSGFQFSGTIAGPSGAVFEPGATYITGPFPTAAVAKSMAITWAESVGAQTIYLVVNKA